MFGSLLRVDMTRGEIRSDRIPVEWVRDYIGGSSLAARVLFEFLRPELDPLDPSNPLLWMTGPLVGTAGTTTGRFTICGRSPQTGLWGESNIGGFVGPELRQAGWDAVIITGRSDTPVYLWIHNDQVSLRPAGHMWGQADTYETQALIRAEVEQPQAKVACIGLAGENGVSFAGIFSDHARAAARTGLGKLMGSKNLKALAVRGTGKIFLADPERYKKLRLAANKELIDHNMTQIWRATGTSGAAEYLQMLGDMPQKYWTSSEFEGVSEISGAAMAETILTRPVACQGCVIACGREVQVKAGPYATPGKIKGPEYETICAFGSQLMIADLPAITALGERCDRLGLDTISAGSTIALAYLMYERGLLTTADTGGLELKWGDPAPAFAMLELMARCEGFGALLARGSKALGKAFGCGDLAVEVNGLDVAMHDPRAFSGEALSYVTSPRGACHNQSDFFQVELGGAMEDAGIPMTERFTDSGKAAYVARHQHWRSVHNALVMCFFAVVPAQTVADQVAAATGEDRTIEDLIRIGERAWNLKRAYNLRLGLTPATEKLPKLLLEPLPDGGQMGYVPDMETLLSEYYAASGWDRATGWPLPEKLRELGLEFAKA